MKYPRGSTTALGLTVGLVIGVLMESIATWLLLGLMFGLIGEFGNQEKQ